MLHYSLALLSSTKKKKRKKKEIVSISGHPVLCQRLTLSWCFYVISMHELGTLTSPSPARKNITEVYYYNYYH